MISAGRCHRFFFAFLMGVQFTLPVAAESMRTTREAFEAHSDAADRALAGLRADFDGARKFAVSAAASAPADGQAR
jgi:hypothetical protein